MSRTPVATAGVDVGSAVAGVLVVLVAADRGCVLPELFALLAPPQADVASAATQIAPAARRIPRNCIPPSVGAARSAAGNGRLVGSADAAGCVADAGEADRRGGASLRRARRVRRVVGRHHPSRR